MVLRERLRRYPTARRIYRRVVAARGRAINRLGGRVTLDRLPNEVGIRLAYQMLLGREPDEEGFTTGLVDMRSHGRTIQEFVEGMRGSEEFANRGFSASMLGSSIHAGRCQFIRSLPKANRIVDLGGTHLARAEGAFVSLGYPYRFEELTIVDLPSDDRHAIYRGDEHNRVETHRGPVTYRYHSMTDLSGFADSSVDLVYSGQSIEHIHPEEGALVLKSVYRMLRPGGYIAIDTPNGRVTRLMQDEFIDPDHKVEYTWPELERMIIDAGLEVASLQGMNYAGESLASGRFDVAEVAKNSGLYNAAEDCYILAVVARKPETS